MNKTIGIYIHIPFCVKKCQYCDFNSIAIDNIPDDIYINAVIKELTGHIKERPILADKTLETIYIGGGTPSLISPNNIKRFVSGIIQTFPFVNPRPILRMGAPKSFGVGVNTQAIDKSLTSKMFVNGKQDVCQYREITIEINPGTVIRDSLVAFKDAGVNRLSIGGQSFNEKTLKSLGRIHSAKDAVRCYEYARMAGFDNIGIDLIFGAPEQSIEEWEEDLETVISLRPEHISTYNLTIEKGTPFSKLQKDGKLILPSEEEQILMYEHAIDKLKGAGYNHYEISNFSLNGFESRHNLRYWSCMDYIGLGSGAHSYIASPDWGMRWWNENNPAVYMQRIKDTGQAIAGKEVLRKEEALEEGIFLGLRRLTGIDKNWFATRFNMPLKELYMHKIAALKMAGLLYEDDNIIRLTRKGLLLSNEVFAELI